jgi:hypothetical protein
VEGTEELGLREPRRPFFSKRSSYFSQVLSIQKRCVPKSNVLKVFGKILVVDTVYKKLKKKKTKRIK